MQRLVLMSGDNTISTRLTSSQTKASLKKLREKRGYLLPHHGLLAISSPKLLEAYDATYTALTLDNRVLTDWEKEIVWLVILISTGEAIATHHLDRLIKSGGNLVDVENSLLVAAWAEGAERHSFVEDHWEDHMEGFQAVKTYRSGLYKLTENCGIAPWLLEIALAACHQCHRRWFWVREHILGAYKYSANEDALAEGLSLAMFPGGIPNFVDACDIWRKVIIEEKVAASEPYKAWAEMSGQGGFDEAMKEVDKS